MITGKTKKEYLANLKKVLSENKAYALHALVFVYNKQTADEQESMATKIDNGVGFSGFDAEIMTSLASQYIAKNYLSAKQMNLVYKKIPHYANQIFNHCLETGTVAKINGLYQNT